MTIPAVEPQPGALQGCGAPNPDPYAYGHEKCVTKPSGYWSSWTWGPNGPAPRACVVDGGHVHSWARPDARYCSVRCRMKALRARRRADRDGAVATSNASPA